MTTPATQSTSAPHFVDVNKMVRSAVSDTPITDFYLNPYPEVVPAEFAREIERENQNMRDLIARALPFVERWCGAMENPKMRLIAEMRDCLPNDKISREANH